MLSRFWHARRVSCLTLVVMVAPIGLETATNVAMAQEGAGSVSVSDAEGFIGDWVLTYDARGTTRQMNLAIKDMDGKVTATVSDERTGDQDISKIAKSGDALELTYERDFGGQTIDVVLTVSLADGALTGEMSFAGGQFTVDVTGAKAGAEGAAESQEPAGESFTPMELDASEAQAFLGDWTVEMDAMGQTVEMTIKLRDVGGKLAGNLTNSFQPDATAFKTAKVTDTGITLGYEVDFGQPMEAALVLKTPEDGKITGTFEVGGGAFSAELAGTKTGDTTTAQASSGEANSSAGSSSTRRRGRRGRGGARASLAIGDNNITVTGGRIPATHADFEQITSPSDGVIVRFVESAALKLRNDEDISFGDTVIKTGIHAEDYPGVYSIWLKKVGDEWHLVFNKKSDVWGTQHDPEADVAEITIESGAAEEAAENLTLKLEADGETGGILKIIWGDQQWTAKFTSS